MKNAEYKETIKDFELKRNYDYIINKCNYLYTWYNLNIYFNKKEVIIEGFIPNYIVVNIYKKYINKIRITINLKNNYTKLVVSDKNTFISLLEYIRYYNLMLEDYKETKKLKYNK
ncbi:MAG: hypothetical protein IJD92_04290 [Bacilli bacterium]|nr:hypothetical protein [Bacilli bacterium]